MAHTTKVTLPAPAFVPIKLYVKFMHSNILTFISHIQASHMRLLHHNASRRVTKR